MERFKGNVTSEVVIWGASFLNTNPIWYFAMGTVHPLDTPTRLPIMSDQYGRTGTLHADLTPSVQYPSPIVPADNGPRRRLARPLGGQRQWRVPSSGHLLNTHDSRERAPPAPPETVATRCMVHWHAKLATGWRHSHK